MQLLLLLSAFFFTKTLWAEEKLKRFEFEGRTQGTSYHISYFSPSEIVPQTSLEDELKAIDLVYSNYRKDSAISLFNEKKSTDWESVPADLAKLVVRSLEFSKKTQGAFDISIGQILKVWGFGPYKRKGVKASPSDKEIEEARKKSGYQQVEARIDPPALRKKHPELSIDLSGIAQGYSVDRIAALLDAKGIKSYLIEIGGELASKGKKADGSTWKVSIDAPSEGGGLGPVLAMQDNALSTSGHYRDYKTIAGKRYSHIFDPRVGRPLLAPAVSASVIAKDCTTADALAKAFLILDKEAQKALAASEGLSVLFLERTDTGLNSTTIGPYPFHE